MRWAFGSLVVVLFVGCTFVRPLEYLSSEQSDASTPATDGGDRDADPGPPDAGADARTCEAGTRIKPVAFFDYVDPSSGATPQALSCNLENVLEEDGNLANLDRKMNGAVGKGFLDQKDVSGCVGVELPSPIEKFTTRFGVIRDACGVTPCIDVTGCATSTGFQATIFAGQTRETLRFVEQQKFGVATLENYSYPAPVINTRFVMVCRSGNVGVERDDIGVDAIWGECP